MLWLPHCLVKCYFVWSYHNSYGKISGVPLNILSSVYFPANSLRADYTVRWQCIDISTGFSLDSFLCHLRSMVETTNGDHVSVGAVVRFSTHLGFRSITFEGMHQCQKGKASFGPWRERTWRENLSSGVWEQQRRRPAYLMHRLISAFVIRLLKSMIS